MSHNRLFDNSLKKDTERESREKRLKNLEKVLTKTELTSATKRRLMKAFENRASSKPTVDTIKTVPRYVHEMNFGQVFNMETLRVAGRI